jgi:hypothetical protein
MVARALVLALVPMGTWFPQYAGLAGSETFSVAHAVEAPVSDGSRSLADQGFPPRCFPAIDEASARAYDGGADGWFGRLGPGLITGAGTWVIADPGRMGIHFIHPTEPDRLVGRRGEGPGEFLILTGLWEEEDGAISVLDMVTGRMTRLDHKGELNDSFRIAADGAAVLGLMGPAPGGGIVAQRNLTRNGQPGVGLYRDSLEVVVERDGREVRVVGPLPGSDRFLEGFPIFPVPFGLRVTYRVLSGGRLLIAPGDRQELRIMDLATGTETVVPVPLESQLVTRDLREALSMTAQTGPTPWTMDLVDRWLSRGELPTSTPVHGQAHVDRSGWIWVQEPPIPGAPARYLVLDREGHVHQRIALPAQVPAHGAPFIDADDSHALFRAEDELGTPFLLVLDRRCASD